MGKYIEKNNSHGFTLLELIVVLAGLGILSSLAIPNVIKYLDYAKVDEAKSLLDSAAADCLQGLRREGTNRLDDPLSENIISDDRLENTGYEFEKNANKCGDTMIVARNKNDEERLPQLGFRISWDGVLSKHAVDTGSDSLYAAKRWAGSNVLEAAGLAELREYEQQIRNAKLACDNSFRNWLKTNPTGSKRKWNTSASSGCPSKPPKIVSSTCTTNGCVDEVFYLDGKYCGTDPKDLARCIEIKLGKLCADKLNQHRANKTTSSTARATIIEECGNKEFWLCKGTDTGSKTALENCLRRDQEASCIAEQENARETGHTGKFGPLPGPGKCGDVKWICEKTFVSEQNYYINCDTPAKAPPAKCSGILQEQDSECIEYELTDTLIQKCGARPMGGGSSDCGEVGRGRPRHRRGWNKFPACGAWAKCMGFQ